MIVDLLRHAESAMNTRPHLIGGRSDDARLTLRGEQQAVRAGAALRARDEPAPAAAWCSGAVRTRRTLELVLQAAGWPLEPQVDQRLLELDQGSAEGRPRDEAWNPAEVARMRADPRHHRLAPDGENHEEVQARMLAAVREIAAGCPGGRALVVGHGVAIRSLVWQLTGAGHDDFRTYPMANVSLTRLRVSDGRASVEFVGLTLA